MKDRPILFTAPNVRAIQEGRKTQTRRIVKWPPPIDSSIYYNNLLNEWRWVQEDMGYGGDLICPYGQPGDRLWVRETWKPDINGEVSCTTYQADGAKRCIENTQEAADMWLTARRPCEQWPNLLPPKWRPSIHMPRWASRITLEITNIRVERLQDISEEDAQAEGAININGEFAEGYAVLWESINGAGSWQENPWVWVIEFKVVTTEKSAIKLTEEEQSC